MPDIRRKRRKVAPAKIHLLAAVKRDGRALQSADESFKSDMEVVLAAVTQDGSALEFAAIPLKSDKDVVLAAVTSQQLLRERSLTARRGYLDRNYGTALKYTPMRPSSRTRMWCWRR